MAPEPSVSGPVLTALAILLPVVSLLLFYAAAAVGQRLIEAGNGPNDRSDGPGNTPRDTVSCPACGAANEPGYRYCRLCVAELPAAAEGGSLSGPPFGRWIG